MGPERLWSLGRRARHAWWGAEIVHEDRWVVSEGGWKLFVRTHMPREARGHLPALLIVPGIGGTSGTFEGFRQPVQAAELARLGCVVWVPDLSGRGRSWGNESYGGPENHGDVRACLRALATSSGVDPDRIGVISFSLGSAAAAGALAQGDRPNVRWWIDWEGPSDREIITAGGRRMDPALGHDLEDDAYWWPREATRHVGRADVPYLRYQSAVDHAQPGELRHAGRMIRAASEGGLPWFQLNDHPRGEVPAEPLWMPSGLPHARRWITRRVRDLHGLA